jgi:allophanate hydrolase subunit 1
MPFTPLEIGLIASLFISVVALLFAYKSLQVARSQQAVTEKLIQKFMKELSVANSGAVGMGQRLLAMEKRLQSPEKNAQKIDYYNDEDFQPYSQAAQLFKMGLDTEEVARRCGLSRAEASLIQMMQLNASEVK